MFKFVLFAAILAFASAKPKPLVVEYEYPVAYDGHLAAYTAPVAYAYSHYDYVHPYSDYTYDVHDVHYDYFRK